jgi:hypothetical protein
LGKKFQKQIQNFSKDFSVKSREKTKLKKNKKSNFFREKKWFFYFFSKFVFFHGKQTNWSQNWPKVAKTCVYVPFIIFVKKKFNLKILKCVKVHTVLAMFSSYFVTYDSNFLKCSWSLGPKLSWIFFQGQQTILLGVWTVENKRRRKKTFLGSTVGDFPCFFSEIGVTKKKQKN